MHDTGLAGAAAVILLIARLSVAAIFLRAGIAKLTDLGEFRLAVANYKIMPTTVVPVAGVAIPVGEASGGILLLLGVAPMMVCAGLAALLVSFSLAIAVNLARGRVFDCGCGGGGTPRLISWRHVVSNLALAVISLAVALVPPGSMELLPGPRGLFSVTVSPGASIPVVLATVLCLLTARMLAAAQATRSG
jgi:uncharacterized membrane protein YphA (DoxX/SURF4 family)